MQTASPPPVQVRPLVPERHPEVIDLVLRRCPHYDRALVVGPLESPETISHATWLEAVTHDGRLAGVGVQFHFVGMPAHMFLHDVVVDERHVGTGVGGLLHRGLLARLPAHARLLTSMTSDREQSLPVAEHWGFTTVQVSAQSELDLAGLPDVVLPDDVTVEVRPRLDPEDEEAVERMLDASQTNPERQENGPRTLAGLRSRAPEGSTTRPVGLLLRVDGAPAGICFGLVNDDVAHVVYTGIAPAHRGRGLALLLKQAFHREAATAGARVARTENEQHNAGIRRVNEALGYRVQLEQIWLTCPVGLP